ncbi:MAG: SRPBCC family protein [Bacteroidota bacterium]
MKTTINKVFTIEASADRVWEHLSDPHKIVPCVPGASLVEAVDDDNYKGEVSLKFGPVKAKYSGQIHFQERDNTARKMVMHGKGLDSKGKGSADMLMNGVVTDVDGKAEVNCSMEVTITGMLAQFGARLINDVTDTVFDQFVGNFQDLLAGKEVDNSINAGKMIKGMFGKKK